jgi:hypothetical protein
MEEMRMMPVREKICVRLTKDLVTALDRYAEKRVRETPGLRLARSDAVRTCLHRCLQDELHEVETMNAQGAVVGRAKGIAPHWERLKVYRHALRSRRVGQLKRAQVTHGLLAKAARAGSKWWSNPRTGDA